MCPCRFGAVFLWDTGSSVGEIVGHSKIINTVDIKQTRPYRLVTGSDDNCTTFLEGPPFKFKCTMSVSDKCFAFIYSFISGFQLAHFQDGLR